jgi:hypothetical protein
MNRRRCFISAAYGGDLGVLQRVLDQNGIAWQWAETMPSRKPLLDSVIDAIRQSDFVVGILPGNAPNANIMLELGIAIGHELPLLLLATGANAIPFALNTFSHFETELQNEKLLSFQLDLFLRSLTTKKSSKRTFTSRSSRASVEVKDEPAPALFHSALEQSVASAIQRAGGRVTIPSHSGRDITPDLLMWLPQQDKELFNPAAVEVKSRIGVDDLLVLQFRLAEFVRASSMGCGLIIVKSINLVKSLARLPPIPYTFVIGLGEFKSKLEKVELASWLKRERNRLAHGVR